MVVIGGWVAKDARQTRQEGGSLCTNATADRGTRICDVSHLPFTSLSTPHAPRNNLATNRKCTTAAGRRTSNAASYASDGIRRLTDGNSNILGRPTTENVPDKNKASGFPQSCSQILCQNLFPVNHDD